jgi:hypothetical protein
VPVVAVVVQAQLVPMQLLDVMVVQAVLVVQVVSQDLVYTTPVAVVDQVRLPLVLVV